MVTCRPVSEQVCCTWLYLLVPFGVVCSIMAGKHASIRLAYVVLLVRIATEAIAALQRPCPAAHIRHLLQVAFGIV